MSTVPGFPDATSPTPETGLLWLTEGSGSTRDKKVQAGTLVTDLLGRAVNSQAAAAAPIVGATDLLPVARGNTGGKASVDEVVAAGIPGGTTLLDSASVLDRTETFPIVQGGAGRKLSMGALALAADVPTAVDIAKRMSTYAQWESAITPDVWSDWGDVVARGRLVVARYPFAQNTMSTFYITLLVVFEDLVNSTNTKPVRLKIPSAALPSGWFAELQASAGAPVPGYPEGTAYYRTNEAIPTKGTSRYSCTYTISPDAMIVDLGTTWAILQPETTLGVLATLSLDMHITSAEFLAPA
jgi:hypothetical protein